MEPIVQQRPSSRIVKGSFYLTQPRKPWLVNGLIREGTTAFVAGREGTGKSFIALELAYCIAEGRDFFGNAVTKHDVLYVAAERGDAQRERIEALRDLKGVNPDYVQFVDEQFKLNIPAEEQRFCDTLDREGIGPRLIIFDTLRASFYGDENSSFMAQSMMDAITRIKRRYNATVVVLHHVNAFGQSRGSSAFIGAADTELYVTDSKKTKRVYLTVRKQNNGKKWLRYTLVPEEIDFGNDYSSIVLKAVSQDQLANVPDQDEAEDEADLNIIRVINESKGELTIYSLQNRLKAMEGSMRNANTLKCDVERLGKDGRFVVTLNDQNQPRMKRREADGDS